jgi:aminobenzoyl-glutamate utilization protein B
MSIGHKGMLFASKLGLPWLIYLKKEQLRKDIKEEFLQKKGKEVWKAMLPDGPPVPKHKYF